MKTLYVTDLDGTLLNKNDQISTYSLEEINALIDKGMDFTFATARSLVSASTVIKGLTTNIPVIVYNGSFLMNAETGEILSSSSFTKAEKQYMKGRLKELGISPIVYSFVNGVESVSWVSNKMNEGKKHYFSNRKGDKRLRPLEDEEKLYEGDVFYFTCIGEKEELLPLYDAFKDQEAYRCTLQQELYREEYWCEIMPKNATKANAVVKLKELLQCDRVVSFGDAVNDLPMFRISQECYAVANAVEELKKEATHIIGSNEEDGVAKWLVSNVLFIEE